MTDGKLASERFEGELDSAAYQRMAAEAQAEFVEKMRALIDAAHSLAVAIVQELAACRVFPAVVGASLGVGAEYGRGALRVAGRTEATTAPPQDRRASRRAPAALKRKVRGILACLKNGNYTTDIVDAMLLYARAFDEWNQNTAFTMLRSAVERLASPGRGDYDDVVRRCAFLWEEPEYMARALERLREYRNGYMHTGTEMATPSSSNRLAKRISS